MVWHVDNKTAPLVKPRKQPVFSKEIRYFTDEIGQTPTVPQADWFNMVQGELLQLAKVLGVTPDKLNDGQIGEALKAKLSDVIPKTAITHETGTSKDKVASQFLVSEIYKAIMEATEVPVDKIFAFESTTPPKGYIARNGQAIDKATMPKLYARYGERMPDDRDRVLRMAGELAGTAGETQEDAMQRISGGLSMRPGSSDILITWAGGALKKGVGANSLYYAGVTASASGKKAETVDLDSSLVARTSTETRAKSRIVILCNKIQ